MVIDGEKIILNAICEYGVEAQTDMMIEEMSELAKALLKYRRKVSDETLGNVIEEMADVRIMLDQMIEIYDRDGRFAAQRTAKLLRLAERIGITPTAEGDGAGGSKEKVRARIKIYRINRVRDTDNVVFLTYSRAAELSGGKIRSEIYDLIYNDEICCDAPLSPEAVYLTGFCDPPAMYIGGHLDVSDVVEICAGDYEGFWYCDSVGFAKIYGFDPDKTGGRGGDGAKE